MGHLIQPTTLIKNRGRLIQPMTWIQLILHLSLVPLLPRLRPRPKTLATRGSWASSSRTPGSTTSLPWEPTPREHLFNISHLFTSKQACRNPGMLDYRLPTRFHFLFCHMIKLIGKTNYLSPNYMAKPHHLWNFRYFVMLVPIVCYVNLFQ